MEGLLPDFQVLLIQVVALLLTAFLLPRLKVSGPLGALLMVVVLSYVNTKFWDAALFFQLPDSFTLNAAILVFLNGALFWVLVKLLPGIEVEGVLPAIAAPLLFTVLMVIIQANWGRIDWKALQDGAERGIAKAKQEMQEQLKEGEKALKQELPVKY